MSIKSGLLSLGKKQCGFSWKDHTFIVQSKVTSKYLFLASTETIYMDGKLVLEIGGFNFKTKKVITITDCDGIDHIFEFHCQSIIDTWLPISIMIDGEIIYTGGVQTKGLLLSILIYFPIFFVLFLALLYSFNLITISFTL